MELSYWEKQLILYTKGHFGRIDYDKDLKRFAAKAYGLGLEHTDPYNVMNFVTDLYTEIYENGLIRFKLKDFIENVFKRNRFNANNDSINRMDILKQMLAEIQGMKVLGVIELGEADRELLNEIDKEEVRTVKYVGGLDHYDGLTTDKKYSIITESDSQYIVRNDFGDVSRIQKSKFEHCV